MLPRNQTKILIRATNWLGDAVMSLPAVRAVRESFPAAHITVLARGSVGELYARESAVERVMPYAGGRRAMAAALRGEGFDYAILLPNSFDAALTAWMAHIPRRIGYRRDGRGWLLTEAIPPPEPGEIPRHERFYYLELLRRAGIIHEYPPCAEIRLDGRDAARAAGLEAMRGAGLEAPVIGVSPGAAYGEAKRWLPERFAEAAGLVAHEWRAAVALFGSAAERPLCESVAATIRGRRSAGAELRWRNDSRAIHRSGGCVPAVSDERFRRDARRVGSGRSLR